VAGQLRPQPSGKRGVILPALPGPPTLLYMTSVQLKFVAEAGDPKGTWTAQVVVRDLLRNVSLPLQARFDVR
jgi:hypothetical protein